MHSNSLAAFQLIQNVPDILRANAFKFELALDFSQLSQKRIYIIRAGWNISCKLLTNRNEMFIESFWQSLAIRDRFSIVNNTVNISGFVIIFIDHFFEYFPSILYVFLVFFEPIGTIISRCSPDAIFDLVFQMLVGLSEIFGASLISFFFK